MTTASVTPHKVSRWIGWLLIGLVILVLAVSAVFQYGLPWLGNIVAQTPPSKASAQLNSNPTLAQCRVDAVVAYMQSQGFEDGDYVIGEENIDPTAPGLLETGSLAFGKDGQNVLTNDALQAMFDSSEPTAQAVRNSQTAKFPSVNEDILFDAQKYEIVQSLIPTQTLGNTGYVNGLVVSMGTRINDPGDGAWLFVDTEACVVPVAEVQPATAKPGDPPAVGLIRPGCINPGDNLVPNLVPSPPPVCTPDKPCKDSPTLDPYPSGNAPVGGGPNVDPSPGTYIPPAQMEQPSEQPRVDPTAPAPTPGPGPTSDPAPAPQPEPQAPAPSDPVTPDEGNGCAPGLSSC